MNRFCYRLPNSRKIVGGKSEHLLKGIRPSGFVVHPFDGNPGNTFTIPADEPWFITEDEYPELPIDSAYPFPDSSTSRESHRRSVLRVRDEILAGNLDKCVVARVEVHQGDLDILRMFSRLCREYPSAFIFYFSTPETGTWMGASPELLLRMRKDKVCTMALAGTRPARTEGDWDEKNRKEQAIVRDWIEKVMEGEGFDCRVQPVETVQAGPVEHIRSVIEGFLTHSDLDSASRLAMRLSPTPALCGAPLRESLRLIGSLEDFCRGYYGGFCGPVGKQKLDLYVNLRSMRMEKGRFSLFAGGGIMEDSDPDAEWLETERKMQTLKDFSIDKTTITI